MNTDYNLKYSQYSSKEQVVSEKEESRSAWEFYPHDATIVKESIEQIDPDAKVQINKGFNNNLFIKFYMDEENYDIEEVSERILKIWQEGKMNRSNCDFCFYINDVRKGPYISFHRIYPEEAWMLSVTDSIFGTDKEKFEALNKKIQELFVQEPYITLS